MSGSIIVAVCGESTGATFGSGRTRKAPTELAMLSASPSSTRSGAVRLGSARDRQRCSSRSQFRVSPPGQWTLRQRRRVLRTPPAIGPSAFLVALVGVQLGKACARTLRSPRYAGSSRMTSTHIVEKMRNISNPVNRREHGEAGKQQRIRGVASS